MTNDEVSTLVELLNKCEVGNLNPDVFVAIDRLTVTPGVEFIPLRRVGNEIQALLIPREATDKVWPGMLHTPGSIFRPTDQNINDVFERLFKGELGLKQSANPTYVDFNYGHGKRGAGLGIEYIIELIEKPEVGEYYNVETLPDNFIPDQQDMLNRAVQAYKNLGL